MTADVLKANIVSNGHPCKCKKAQSVAVNNNKKKNMWSNYTSISYRLTDGSMIKINASPVALFIVLNPSDTAFFPANWLLKNFLFGVAPSKTPKKILNPP